MKTFDFEIEVIYGRSCDNDLNARLDVTAEKGGGTFISFEENEKESVRKYGFYDEELADDFLEEANFAISRHFGFEFVKPEELSDRIRWDFDEAIYHHIEFASEKSAIRFASWFRSVFATYMEPDMFDVFILSPELPGGGYVVIWAFPMESVIQGVDFEDDEEFDDVDDLFSEKTKKRVLN